MQVQRTFGPPPITSRSLTLVQRHYEWFLIARTCRQGMGWSPAEMVEYGPMSLDDAANVAADVALSWTL